MSISAAPAGQRTRNMSLLTAAQTLYQCCISVDLTLTGIVGLSLAPSPVLATVPFALISIVSWLTTYPASAFMRRHGRRAGFLVGSLAAVIGGLISVLAVTLHSYPLFCLGVACIGVFQALAGYYRYTAADISPADQRAKAISTVLSGGILAAVAGPFLATAVSDVLPVVFAGSYALVTALGLASTAVVAFMTVDSAEKAVEKTVPAGEPRTLRQIARQPVFLAGVAGAGAGYFTMTLAMTAAPIAASGSGHSVHEAASVIQWHMVGMYATAFVSGRLAARIGAAQTVLAGVVVNAAGALIALSSSSHTAFVVALALIGIGWNLMFVSGTTLLAGSYLPCERSVTQGVSEMFTLGASALGALTAGPLLSATSWPTVNAFLLVPLAISAVFAVLHLVKK
ncbi:MFS transporter [Lentzea sp. NPDC051838]|uniref:MFS transporter n=1 Tax=Lentzea sp. NPDC051838 TaxID=3154849 RepID=UPI0034173389